jgi:hypothetical protein
LYQRPIEVLGSYLGCPDRLDHAHVRKINVDLAFIGCDFLIEAIQVLQLRYVASHSYDIFADFLRGFIQLRLSPSPDETNAPSATKRIAVASPIPLLPPVITATLPSNACIVLLLLRGDKPAMCSESNSHSLRG